MLYYPNKPRYEKTDRPLSARKLRQAMCPCLCHDMDGSGHPNERCRCNGGTGIA